MDGEGTMSPLELEKIRTLTEQRLPVQSKVVAYLLERVIKLEAENDRLRQELVKKNHFQDALKKYGGCNG